MTGRFVRLAETDRAPLELRVDGRTIRALEGDTLLTALLQAGRRLRASEFGDGERAGFCLMGACQDCWVWTEQGGRLRACSTFVTPGMSVLTEQPGATWPTPG
jgi:NADH dehydrogenase/NADH:ubiquinone oxidoreductase subunit G